MIILSAGHDPLAQGAGYNGFSEYPEAVRWVNEIHNSITNNYLYPCAIAPHCRTNFNMVKDSKGRDVPEQSANQVLANKIDWINQHQGCVFTLEVHFNSDESKRQHGSETLYAPGSEAGRWAAGLIQDELAGLFPPSRGVKEGWYRMDHPGRIDYPGDIPGDEKPDAFLTWTRPVAIIVEPEFIYNREVIEAKRAPACVALSAVIVHIAETLSKGMAT